MSPQEQITTLEVIGYILDCRGITFSKNDATKILGSRRRLERLVREGKIRTTKENEHQHGKWRCNAADVLLNAEI